MEEPSDLYNKSKRNLVIFVAVLALTIIGEIDPSDTVTWLGAKINSRAVPTTLLMVVVYLLYQYFLAHSFQPEATRTKVAWDFRITTGLAAIVVAIYIFYYLMFQILKATTITIAAVAFLILVMGVLVAYFLGLGSDALKFRRVAEELRIRTLRERLSESGWVMNFNPKHSNGKKEISFNEDGTIGRGRNNNEYRWELDNDILTIIRADKSLQNKFRYDAADDVFRSTDEPVAKGYKGQYIFKGETPDIAAMAS